MLLFFCMIICPLKARTRSVYSVLTIILIYGRSSINICQIHEWHNYSFLLLEVFCGLLFRNCLPMSYWYLPYVSHYKNAQVDSFCDCIFKSTLPGLCYKIVCSSFPPRQTLVVNYLPIIFL